MPRIIQSTVQLSCHMYKSVNCHARCISQASWSFIHPTQMINTKLLRAACEVDKQNKPFKTSYHAISWDGETPCNIHVHGILYISAWLIDALVHQGNLFTISLLICSLTIDIIAVLKYTPWDTKVNFYIWIDLFLTCLSKVTDCLCLPCVFVITNDLCLRCMSIVHNNYLLHE